ncbi:MAG TPA: ATP-binding protein [Solirubrobacteraceae bacterium]|nr:ATP-binding protein [Solirubrobacteraceae bacterium]
MDPLANPYSMSAGNPPRALTGRETQKQQFRTMLGRLAREMNEPSMIVFGLRGVGKTVLLLEFESIADASGWTAPDPIEIRSDTDFRAELADAAYQALLRLDRRRALGDRLKTFTRLLSGFKVGASIEGSVEFSFDPSAVGGGSGNLERDLTHLFVELGDTARAHETGVVFLIDEMQFLKREEMEAVAAAMHRMSQKQLPIALAGAGLPQLPGLMVDAKSYAERLFSYPEIGPLSPDAARQALFEPAQAEGVDFEDDALARIVELSGCYAAFVQAYGKETWNMAPGSPITLADVQAAEPVVQAKLDEEFFHVRFEKATPAERRYMAAMADLGDGPYKTGDVAGRLGGRASSSSVHRDSLIKKGLIFSPDHGEVNFTVPHFSPFMRRRYPL